MGRFLKFLVPLFFSTKDLRSLNSSHHCNTSFLVFRSEACWKHSQPGATPVVRQKPQRNLWLEFACHTQDRMLTLYWINSSWLCSAFLPICDVFTMFAHVYTLFRWDFVFDLLSACVPWSLQEDAKHLNKNWIFELTKRLESSLLDFKSRVSILNPAFNWKVSVKFLEVFPTRMNDMPQEYVGMLMQFPETMVSYFRMI